MTAWAVGGLLLSSLVIAQEEIPDNSWGAWWPTAQWSRKSAPPEADAVRAAHRDWNWVSYPRIETPWGSAAPSFSILEVEAPFPERRCLRFDLVFSGPGTTDEEAWKKFRVPPDGAIRADIVSRGKSIRVPTNGDLKIAGWVGGARGTSGNILIEFDWLPDDVEDYWVRVRLPERTFWFLIPYGLGCDPRTPVAAVAGRAGAPTSPEGRDEKDAVVAWSEVDIDLGWTDASWKIRKDKPKELKEAWAWTRDKRNVSIRLSNAFDGKGALTLYKESHDRWSLVSPRTTAAIGIPGERVLFSTLDSIGREGDHLKRKDAFGFWRQPSDLRRWGLLRVTVEETAFEVAVPGSLFLYTHGAPR